MKINCWDFKKCGRESNGTKAAELGVCPAAIEKRLDGIHGGINAGRSCWAVAGTLCGGVVQGTYAEKEKNCVQCDFHKLVSREEFGDFKMSHSLHTILKDSF